MNKRRKQQDEEPSRIFLGNQDKFHVIHHNVGIEKRC